MDPRRFEDLSRLVARAGSRREALKALAAGLVAGAGIGAGLAKAPEAEAGLPIVSCKIPGERCQGDKACCSGKCGKGVCKCLGKGSACWQPMEGALCCSGRCREGKCK